MIFLNIYEKNSSTINRAVIIVTVEKDQQQYQICTTHFTWTRDGEATDTQRTHLKNLLAHLKSLGELVLAGDFNAPRGKEIFTTLSQNFKDNIPKKYKTSIDGNIHRAGHLPHMVDGLFTTSHYKAHRVKLQPGLSDHCGIVADISKA